MVGGTIVSRGGGNIVGEVEVVVSRGEEDSGMVGGMIVSRGGGSVVWRVVLGGIAVSRGGDRRGRPSKGRPLTAVDSFCLSDGPAPLNT
jgi:hypothetical protein